MAFAGPALAAVIVGCGQARASASEAATVVREPELTIYKQDFAMVTEARQVELGSGLTRLNVDNVSRSLDPQSVTFDWREPGPKPDVVANTYDLGAASGGALLKRYVGREVEMYWPSENGAPRESVKGVLELADDGMVLRSGDRYYINPTGTIVAPAETSVVARPRLNVQVNSPTATRGKLAVSYLTRGMSWSADYVATLDPAGRSMRLECWATIANQTGVDYPSARLSLVAGSPNRAVVAEAKRMRYEESAAASPPVEAQAGRFNAAPVGDLYSYKVPSPATIGQEQLNRVRMMVGEAVPVKKDYSVRLSDYAFGGRQNAQVSVSFTNSPASGLGQPLPAGAVRLYEGTSAYVGAATLADVPKDERVSLTLSDAFDVYVKSKRLSQRRLDKQTYRTAYEVELHNEKQTPVDVRVVHGIGGRWKLPSESTRSVKLDAETAQWTVPVPAGGKVILRYSIDRSG
jgi:hypothetical protein